MNRATIVLISLILALALVEAAPAGPKIVKHKPKKVKCKDKKSPCYHKDLYCPTSCPRDCNVDCNRCEPVCTPVPPLPPPPPKVVKAKEVKCKDRILNPSCFNKKLYCPASCPRTCNVDCLTCQPICGPVPVPYPPPPPTNPSLPQSPPYIPPTSNSDPKHVRCTNKKYPSCYFRQFTCPAACSQSCDIDCSTCGPVCNCNKPGAVCQDPRFVGADGITFYFHGKKETDFCLVTDSNLHINGHFIGKRNANMGRDFTWVQSLGILFDHHKLYIGALKTGTWNDAIDRVSLSFDGQPITLPETEGATWKSMEGDVSMTRTRSANAVEIEAVGKFKIKAVVVPITEKDSMIHQYGITQEDCFAHLDLSFKFQLLSEEVNGVLGQTYANNYVSRVKMGVAMSVLGGEREFSSSGIFSTDCRVARFTGTALNSTKGIELPHLNCVAGTETGTGHGVVCKR